MQVGRLGASCTAYKADQVAALHPLATLDVVFAQMGIEGKVFVEFVVDKDGTITNVKAIKGIGAGCDEEAKRVIEGAPKWSPGKQRGRPVKVRMILPITFKLG